MRVNFNSVILHNFLSYGHSELDLTNKNFCTVKGINRCPKDNALSNGAGKSTFISAICWALTGETVQGIKSDLKNIYIDEKSCYVKLDLTVDDNHFEITRYVEPKSDLKIFVNGEDKSGKGIKESELVLAQYLPDLTTELITSVIILGQGLPNRFSLFKPSGRKELLERLSKSDFMIQDLKDRLAERSNYLNIELRKHEDNMNTYRTKISMFTTSIQETIEKLNKLKEQQDFDSLITSTETEIEKESKIVEDLNKNITNQEAEYKTLYECLNKLNSKKLEDKEAESKAFESLKEKYLEAKYPLTSNINTLTTQLRDLDSVRDVCPTCGQKMPGVNKEELENRKKELKDKIAEFRKTLDSVESSFVNSNQSHNDMIRKIDETYQQKINDLNIQSQTLQNKIKDLKNSSNFNQLNELKIQLSKYISDRDNHLKNIKEAEESLYKNQNLMTDNQKFLEEETAIHANLNERLLINNQMGTLVKRDFRGFLLSSVIQYIGSRAKEYCQEIFSTSELTFELDGNNIEISYCGKNFDGLSGGEKQKVDLIIQFALRDMMSKYLDFRSNILCLDEIFDNLDISGTTNVLNLISTKLKDVESVFIISHHDDLEIPADSEILVEKNSEGISRIL